MTAPEPLTTTLEELAVLHGIVVWKDPTSEAWVAGYPRYVSPHSLEWEPLGIGATWPEAASDALHRPVVARDEAADPKPIGWDDVTVSDVMEALLDCQEQLKQTRDEAAELRAALAEMSDLVYTIRHAEEELENTPLLRDAGRSTAHMREAIENAWERLCELAALHDDTSALAASEGQP